MTELETKKRYISWPVLALMDFVTVVGFDDLTYNFQNQGMGVITSWIIMIAVYVVPYSLMVGQLGSTFDDDGGGLTSWVRETSGEFMGYFAAWTYWAASIPYVVDTANTIAVAIGWVYFGDAKLQTIMSNSKFALFTLLIFVFFIIIQSRFEHSLEVLSTIGGVAMFGMTVLFVIMTVTALMMGGHIATKPLTMHTIVPTFNLHYLTTLGFLIFAINGAERIAPFVTKMRNPNKDFPKAMIMLSLMTGFLTIFGSFSLGVFFNAYHLPNDLKINGSYYAFQALGQRFHMGNTLMYLFALTEIFYLAALLAVLLNAMTRMLISDTGNKYMPEFLRRTNSAGLPINGYLLTVGLSAFIMFLGILLPNMKDIFNWLLNLNGIISPGVTCWIFWSFIKVRMRDDIYHSGYVYIKNKAMSLAVGWWCLGITGIATLAAIGPQDVPFASPMWWYELTINFIAIIVLIGLGFVLPYITKRERRSQTGSAFTRFQMIGIWTAVLATLLGDLYLGDANFNRNIGYIALLTAAGVAIVIAFGRREYNLKESLD
ncbi:amino acid permease [Companilactobacillus mindensis DSM 14500]|uniref:Amino acid permease n=1 Tax=Companilactobacillus mindensis DSM 14500 TaxID=1423770 RepID=A0A0R1QJZ4_9LACO|nr:amino acid permease [Companilactobacillus mindensis]KRL44924.1 amino acid permease [Companilactobacillus mindensis DSM 14500]GEO79310.1 amino acid permease [Companilactobacillus mindensis]